MTFPPSRSGRARRARACALVLLALAAPAGRAADTVAVSADQEQSLGIQTAPLGRHAGAVATGLPARVVIPPQQVHALAAPVGGLVAQVAKAHNDPVAAGEAVFVLSSAQLVDDQAALFKAASQQRLLAENSARDGRLLKEGIVPEARYRAARAEEQRAEAEVRALRERLRLAGLDPDDVRRTETEGALTDRVAVRAPIAGVLVELDAGVGARAEAGTLLGKVADLSRLWLEVQVPVDQAALLQPGMPVTVPGVGVAGRLALVESEMSGAQTVTVRAEMGEAASTLRPGQSVEARIGALADARHWRVPSAALAWQSGGTYLFVAAPGGFRAVPVQVLSQSAATAGVTGELSGEERIAVKGVAALKSIWLGKAEAGQ